MTVGSLFAGIGGFDLAAERVGWEVKWQVEIDPFCRRVLEKHWPKVRRYEDVREVCGGKLRRNQNDGRCAECGRRDHILPADVICGGFPCQDISPAGKKAGINGSRSGLWSEFARLVGELRPRYVVVENSADLLVRGMGRVVGDLAALGYDAEWEVVSACAFRAPHTRPRVLIVAYPARGCEPGQAAHAPYVFQERRTESRGSGDDAWYLGEWLPEPGLDRVADGIPRWMVQPAVGALGNAVLPQKAEWIFRQIQAHEETVTAGARLTQPESGKADGSATRKDFR